MLIYKPSLMKGEIIMNGKFSKYFSIPEAFIEKVIINRANETVELYHPKNKKPTIYEDMCEGRDKALEKMEEQINVITQNSKKIIKNENKKAGRISFVSGLIAVIGAFMYYGGVEILSIPDLYIVIPTVASGLSCAGFGIANIVRDNKINKEINLYRVLKANQEKLNSQIIEDENMTRYLSQTGIRMFEEQKNLQQEGLADNLLDALVIDNLITSSSKKAAIKDAEELILRSKINDGLSIPASFDYETYRAEKKAEPIIEDAQEETQKSGYTRKRKRQH